MQTVQVSRALFIRMKPNALDFFVSAAISLFNTNSDCRDQYGHFCGTFATEDGKNTLQCASSQESCDIFVVNEQQSCPLTCVECPLWEPTNPSELWYLLMFIGIATPISVWFFLPFLRGKYHREDNCYGLFSFTKSRFLGVCGTVDDNGFQICENTGSGESEGEQEDSKAFAENIELT